MKKTKIIMIITVGLLLMTSLPVAASQGYGKYVSQNTMEGFKYYTDYSAATDSVTSDEAHSGTKSYMIKLSEGGTINLHTNNATVSDDACYYAQVYAKGASNGELRSKDALWVCASTDYENRVFLTQSSPADENGWARYSAYVTPLENQTVASLVCYIGSSVGFESTPILYLDDFSIQIAPCSISTTDITGDANKPVNLRKIRIFGYDKNGNKELIDEPELLEWKVLSGDATVDRNGNLVCTNKAGTVANVQVSFCGAVTTFNVAFSGGLGVSAPIKTSDGTFKVIVDNPDLSGENVYATVVLYDNDGRLYDARTVERYIEPSNQSEILLPDINVPFNINNAVKMVVITTPYSSEVYDLK